MSEHNRFSTAKDAASADDTQLIDDIMRLAVEIRTKSMTAIPTALVAAYRIECEYPDIIKALAESKYIGGKDIDDFGILGTSAGDIKQSCCCSEIEALDILSAIMQHPYIGQMIKSAAISNDAYFNDAESNRD